MTKLTHTELHALGELFGTAWYDELPDLCRAGVIRFFLNSLEDDTANRVEYALDAAFCFSQGWLACLEAYRR